jgi:DNA replication protein DnaC
MTPEQRRALAAVDLDWARTPDDVWERPEFHVDGLHQAAADDIVAAVAGAAGATMASPLGVVVRGQRGTGKTHLLGELRDRVQAAGAYFFLITIGDGSTFWESAALCMVNGLLCPTRDGQSQLRRYLDRLTMAASVPMALENALTREGPLTPEDLNQFAVEIKRLNRAVGQECRDTARALVLYGSNDSKHQDIGYDYLLSMNEMEAADRAYWGIRPGVKPAQRVVGEISRLLALTGPTLIAVDQIDAVLNRSDLPDDLRGPRGLHIASLVGDGLMSLREITRRTVSVVSCLPHTWEILGSRSAPTAVDRFRLTSPLKAIDDPAVGAAIIARRLEIGYRRAGFTPPYPTWPVHAEAFAGEHLDLTPRQLLQAVDQHIRNCLSTDEVTELYHVGPVPLPPPALDVAADATLSELDSRFDELRRGAAVTGALTHEAEDAIMPGLLSAGLACWVDEHRDLSDFEADPAPHGKLTLHARLRQILNEITGEEAHWSFRAIASPNPVAALSRLRNASILAGVTERAPTRRLTILRNLGWSKGKETQKALAALAAAGGVTLSVDEDDLATFAALRQLREEAHPAWAAWLAQRQPATNTKLLSAALVSTLDNLPPAPAPIPAVLVNPDPLPQVEPAIVAPMWSNPLVLGQTVEAGRPAVIELESLRRHSAIFAGSGSGKTVLIRRIVEECALQGVSSIVLDPNNDLARLGDAWPQEPPGWGPEDADRAKRYLAETDVVVWTPRREGGRPLTFQPLPDFAGIMDDADEFGAAVDAAVASLAPRAKVDGGTAKATHGQAVLKEALISYVRSGGSDLRGYIEVLRDLPEGVSALDKGERIANEMAQTLLAETVIDPLFGGEGTPLDPGQLFTPTAGKSARVSVISLVGLQGDEQRQSFVNQLQMALFAWIKQHPAGNRALGGLFVMDEAQSLAPSGALTACTQSTLALASQARKYGLGLVFATQAPKALHNRIAGNATTQFFGLLNAPTQIDAARDMARAKGADVPDIARLTTGQFYAAGEGLPLTKIQAPNCLSHHPKSPLTTEEVIRRARS